MFKDKQKLIAAIGYLFFFVPLFMKEKDEAVRFHARQATGLFIVTMALSGCFSLVASMVSLPFFLTVTVVRVFFLVGVLTGIMNVAKGNMQPLPFIGIYIVKAAA